ncbi:ATP-binding protein [Corynebacterium hadale]
MGKTPPVVAGRDSYVQDFAEALYDGPGTHERISIVTGPRGIGKTVLLNEFEEAARQQSWLVISETTTEHFNERIRDTLIRKIREATPDSTRLSFDSTSDQAPSQSLRSVLEECFSLLETIDQKMGKPPTGILITLDELHYAHVRDIIEFGTTMQHMIREDREIAVAMAGIPGAVKRLLASNEGRNPVTFLRRANRIAMGLVPLDSVANALKAPALEVGIEWTPEALELGTEATGGYPFMIQLVGQHAFRNTSGGIIDESAVRAGIETARRKLGELVHEPSLADLSDVDRTFLTSMSKDDGPSRMADIAERMGVDTQYAGTYRRRLIEAEMIRPAGRGFVDYELPYIREYLRAHPASDAMEQLSFPSENYDA